MLWFESPSQWWIPSKIGVWNSSSLQSSLNPSQQRTPSYCKVRLCPSPRIHSGLKEQLVQLLEQPRYWTTNIWLNSVPHPEMRGKVDFTRILDLIFNPTPVNDAMGEVFILSFFHQCWPSRGSSMPNPNGQTNLRSAPISKGAYALHSLPTPLVTTKRRSQERKEGLEPSTSALARLCSTIKLFPPATVVAKHYWAIHVSLDTDDFCFFAGPHSWPPIELRTRVGRRLGGRGGWAGKEGGTPLFASRQMRWWLVGQVQCVLLITITKGADWLGCLFKKSPAAQCRYWCEL